MLLTVVVLISGAVSAALCYWIAANVRSLKGGASRTAALICPLLICLMLLVIGNVLRASLLVDFDLAPASKSPMHLVILAVWLVILLCAPTLLVARLIASRAKPR